MKREKPLSLRFSARTLWFLDALKDSGGYGETRSEIVRKFVLEGIGRAQTANHIPRSVRGVDEIRAPSHDDDL